jgi:hypothetical protein
MMTIWIGSTIPSSTNSIALSLEIPITPSFCLTILTV